jgi:hypothetical protein
MNASGLGALVVLGGVVLLASPLLLGSGSLIKYIVVIGFLAVCVGASLVLHGLLDWLRSKAR